VARGGITFTMLWDPSGRSWTELGVRQQPAALLFAADGTRLGRWDGSIDSEIHDEILRLAGA
jgi:hypothetical protein